MGIYRIYRNLEASIIDYITDELIDDGWSGIRVEKSFSQVFKGELPCICITMVDSDILRREIGSNYYYENITLSFKIFATSDGQRLDLAAWLLEKIMNGMDYYQYTIENGEITTKKKAGKIQINKIVTNKKELTNTENLEKEDKYRHLIETICRVALQ